ncbi:MAG TPA: SUMF1/EgtB/PvdO family nonheme iron enzyme [Xanthobacteraceae bacterium]|nr:SUMF1/EgtB/PvdO family nonheme iron enzyme [Xanthobacteraceae bacterium]
MRAGSPDPRGLALRPRHSIAALAFGVFAASFALFSPTSARVEPQKDQASTRGVEIFVDQDKAKKAADERIDKIREKLSANHSFALVLGIDTFDKPAWPRLAGVLNEIQEIRAALEAQDFHVETNLRANDEAAPNSGAQAYLAPLNAQDLRHKIGDFLARYGRDAANRLVIYVATHGHAARDPKGNAEAGGYGYLVTKDSPDPRAEDFAAHAFSVKDLADGLVTVEAQHIYFFFNACFSGAMVPQIQLREKTESGVLQGVDENVIDWAQRLLAHNARLIITAGSDDQTVPDVNNPFSKAVIEGLAGAADQDGDGLILGSELASYIRARVAAETRKKLHPNDPVFAFVPKVIGPGKPRSDLKLPSLVIDYAQNGDFVFVSPRGRRHDVPQNEGFSALQQKLPKTQSIDCPDCPIMIKIADGEKATPKIPPFALAQTETTFAQWDACYRDFYCHSWIDDHGLGRGDRPVAGITWQDALQFISWLNAKKERSPCEEYRLPSPAEWTFAARGNTSTHYPWGERAEADQANCWNCGSIWDGTGPAPVARFSPNAFELYDMIGNLWEWVEAPGNQCKPADMLANGGCPTDGNVMGGAFSTRLEDISFETMGNIPRTSNEKHRSYRLDSVGLRAACTLRKG